MKRSKHTWENTMAKKKTKKKSSNMTSEFVPSLERLARLMRSAEHELGLNPAQWEALRFLARANRFSNSPIALTRFLGATKGTISQTLIALERKGYIEKSRRPGERRSIVLSLTADGRELLKEDPWKRVEHSFGKGKSGAMQKLADSISHLLADELAEKQLRSFGTCTTCRFFREKGAKKKSDGPHYCLLLEQNLSKKDAKLICIDHEAS
jgi:DNA-binding MarR family transcriptional regulator